MKIRLLILIAIVISAFSSCNNDIGYLKTDNASYTPDSLVIPLIPDAFRINNNAKWVTLPIAGVLGTQPLEYSIEDVQALDGTSADAAYFKNHLEIIGGGVMYYPIFTDSIDLINHTGINLTPVGRYRISLKVKNHSYSSIISDAYTFVVVSN